MQAATFRSISPLTSDIPVVQALKKNEKNTKALFRKAKGLGEQGYFEKAEKILEELLKTDSTGQCML